MRPLVTDLTVGLGFLVLGSILPVVVVPGLFLSYYYRNARKEEERFIGDCLVSSPSLLLCILENVNILGIPSTSR